VIESCLRIDPGIAALVLVPTRELAMQVVDNLTRCRQSASSRGTGRRRIVPKARSSAIRKGARSLSRPRPVEDYLDAGFSLYALRMLILDEADRMLEWDFSRDQAIVSIFRRVADHVLLRNMEGDMARIVKDIFATPFVFSFARPRSPRKRPIQAFEVAMDRARDVQRFLVQREGKVLGLHAPTRNRTNSESLNRKVLCRHDSWRRSQSHHDA